MASIRLEQSAINFYKKFDAEISKDWLNGKLTKKQIEDINKLF